MLATRDPCESRAPKRFLTVNKQRNAWVCTLAAVVLRANIAGAMHPDHEGERGLELQLTPGYGGAFTHDESVFLVSEELPRPEVRQPNDAFVGSIGVSLAAGWRFTPYLSAGLTGGFQHLTAASEFAASEAAFAPYDTVRSFHVGAYARVYPMAFFNGSRTNPRVFFDSWGDRRRFEPWLSLGVDYVQYSRNRRYDDVRVIDSYTDWTTRYLGIPITVGFDYRLFAPLAVGVNVGFTPLVGGGTSKTVFRHERTPTSDTTTTTETSYAPAADSNTAYFVGLSARYTFTW